MSKCRPLNSNPFKSEEYAKLLPLRRTSSLSKIMTQSFRRDCNDSKKNPKPSPQVKMCMVATDKSTVYMLQCELERHVSNLLPFQRVAVTN